MIAAAKLLVVGASLGGLDAIPVVLGALDAELDLAIAIVQHRSPDSNGQLARILSARSGRDVSEALDAAPLSRGAVWLAPADYHLLVDGARVKLSLDASERHARPSIDALFASAATSWGPRLGAVLLTGSSDDGARGVAAVAKAGGATFVEDPARAEAPESPRAALERITPTHVGDLASIGPQVTVWVKTARSRRTHG